MHSSPLLKDKTISCIHTQINVYIFFDTVRERCSCFYVCLLKNFFFLKMDGIQGMEESWFKSLFFFLRFMVSFEFLIFMEDYWTRMDSRKGRILVKNSFFLPLRPDYITFMMDFEF